MNYTQLMIDPPWDKKKGGTRKVRPNQNRALDYKTMSTVDIFSLLDSEVFPLAAEHHNVFMWTIESFLTETEEHMLTRGYKRHVRFIWNKLNGTAPAFTIRYCHEYLIWFYKPKLLPISLDQRGKFSSIFEEKSRQHSRKPNVAYELIESLYPEQQRIDVFSREKREGWDQWGDQTDHF
jgi:N6-adenosine-specific RNA methylase IME4